jgi:cysteine dioxygenase
MSRLAKRLARNCARGAAGAESWSQVLEHFFVQDGLSLEPHEINVGCVSLIMQTPTASAVVLAWGTGTMDGCPACPSSEAVLREYEHRHGCSSVTSLVVRGSVEVSSCSCERASCSGCSPECECSAAASAQRGALVLVPGRAHCATRVARQRFAGAPGSVSVHVFCTEAMHLAQLPFVCACGQCVAHEPRVVSCTGKLSITQGEIGRSVANICKSRADAHLPPARCGRAMRHYTNFRDLIELLHHEIDPLDEGQVHSPEHIDKISGLLEAVRIDESEFKRYLRFHEGAYTRNLVGYDVPVAMDASGKHKAKFTVLILCWDKGQMSPIHSHAGSSCWVKVLKGQVREIRYDCGGADPQQPPRVVRDLTIGAQQTCYINDTQGVHAMGNPNPDQVSVSLHIYAPPYILCTLFDRETGARRVGNMATARIPSCPFGEIPAGVALASQNLEQEFEEGVSEENLTEFEGLLDQALKDAAVSNAVLSAASTASADPAAGLPLNIFYHLVSRSLRLEQFAHVEKLVERLALQEHEWREFVHFDAFRYTRSLVSLAEDFSLMLCCWNSGQQTPIHSHGPSVRSWVKVLSGRMQLKKFKGSEASAQLQSTDVYEAGSMLSENSFLGLHVLGNASKDEPAVTLHLYSPPFVNMCFVDANGADRVIPVVHSATSAGRCCTADPIASCDSAIVEHRAEEDEDGDEHSRHDDASSVGGSSAGGNSVGSTGPLRLELAAQSPSHHASPSPRGRPFRGHGHGSALRDTTDASSLEQLLSFFKQSQDRNIFCSLPALSRFVAMADLTQQPSGLVVQCLDRMRINHEEWREIVSEDEEAPPALLLARGKRFSIVARRWSAPRAAVHRDHYNHHHHHLRQHASSGSVSNHTCHQHDEQPPIPPAAASASSRMRLARPVWIKVLKGELMVCQYLDNDPVASWTLTDTKSGFVGNKLECEIKNVSSTEPCVAILVYGAE